jgi:diguanylate cyclase (GGDEF)-like protein
MVSGLRVMTALCLCLWWSLASGATAVDAARPLDLHDIGAPRFTSFTARDGLPYAVLVDIRTDRDGFVWAASPAGVFRYDGRRWIASGDEGMDKPVNSLWVDREGTLWAGFRSHGLARHDGTRWHVEDSGTGLPSQQVRRFTETIGADGAWTLRAVTWDQGLMLRREGRWLADPGNHTLPRGPVLSMAQTTRMGGRSRQWAGTGDRGLWVRDEGDVEWRQWHAPGLDSAQVEFLLPVQRHGREELWLSVFGVGLWRLGEDGLRKWSKEDGSLPTNELYDIAAIELPGGDADIWVSTRSGLVRVHDGVQVFDRRHGLPSDVVRALNVWRSPDGKDVLWLATEAGVARAVLGASAWTTASLMGARSIGIFGVLVEPDGDGGERLWVGAADDGLGLYERGQWHAFSAEDGTLPASSVSMLATTTGADGRRTRWLGLRGGALLRIHKPATGAPSFEALAVPWPGTTGEAALDVLARTHDGSTELWVGMRQSGAWRLRDGRWDRVMPGDGLGQWRVGRFQEQRDATGRRWLWASTNRGLARLDGDRWTLFGRDIGLGDDQLSGLTLIPGPGGRQVLWMGSASAGVQRVDVTDPRRPVALGADLPPAPDPTVYGALGDSRGRIYVCTNNGVQLLTPAAGGYRSQVFTRRDGMVHDECNTNAQFIDAHDRFWTGTLGGLAVYDPGRTSRDVQPKPLRITGLRIDGDPRPGPALQVPARARAVEVEFALLSWYREGESRYRTQLLGLEDEPGEWSAQASRSFVALPPGDYVLRVEAQDHAGNRSTPVEVPVSVAARWWETRWSTALAAVLLLLLVHAAVRWRMRAVDAQRHMLERRVAERTAELDLANAKLVDLSYRDALTGLANRRRFHDRLAEATRSPSAAAPTALVLVDVDEFKEFNDRHGHPAGDEALRQVASALQRCVPGGVLVARYGGEEFACLLPGVGMADAAALAERMRVAVEACAIPLPGQDRAMHVTISAGVAAIALHDDAGAHQLMRDADTALYRAKREGRNRVCVGPVDAVPDGRRGT